MRFLRIVWHQVTCVAARSGASLITHTHAGRVYDCGCGFYVMEAFDARV